MKIIPQNAPVDLERIQETLGQFLESIEKSPHKFDGYKPYYRERYAKELIPAIEEVVRTGKPYFFPRGELSVNTIRVRVFQGMAYLKDHLDPTKEYSKMLDRLEIATIRNRGVVLRPKNQAGVLDGYLVDDWKPELLKFIDTAEPNEKFERIGLNLSREQIAWILKQLEPVQHLFIFDIKRSHIKIIRYEDRGDS